MPKIRQGKLTHDNKLTIVDLYEKGWQTFAIRRALESEDVFVSWNGVKNVINQYVLGNFRPYSTVRPDKAGFNVLKAKDLNLIRSTLKSDCNTSSTEIQRKLQEEGSSVGLTTVKKAIDAAGFTASKPRYCQLIKDKNKVARVDFCRELVEKNESFDDAIFTDECTIQLHDNKVVSYREKEAIAPTHCRPKHPLKIHLWGAISKQGPSKLLVFEGIMDSEFYVENVLRVGLLPFLTFFPNGHRFIQDNDPKYRSKRAKAFMTENDINWLSSWPSESCDLNPIEMVWNMLKRHVSRRNPTTKKELSDYCREFWDFELTPEVCTRFIEHNYKLVPLTVKIGGKATGDLAKKLFKEGSDDKDMNYFTQILESPEATEKLRKLDK